MIFSELYGAYYNAVANIIKEALDHPVESADIRRIVEKHAYLESALNIEPALLEEKWQLLKKDGTTIIENDPTMPLTIIQKRFLKAISEDKRIRLFTDEVIDYDVEPLFPVECEPLAAAALEAALSFIMCWSVTRMAMTVSSCSGR